MNKKCLVLYPITIMETQIVTGTLDQCSVGLLLILLALLLLL